MTNTQNTPSTKSLSYGQAGRFLLKKGDILTITVAGDAPQLCDLWMRKTKDHSVSYHPGLTIDNNLVGGVRQLYASAGTVLCGCDESPLMRVVDDGGFRHDLVMPGCRRSVYKRLGGRQTKGCRELIANKMGIDAEEIAGTVNLFFEMDYSKAGKFKVRKARCKKGSRCVLEALADLEVALTACPAASNVTGGEKGMLEVSIRCG